MLQEQETCGWTKPQMEGAVQHSTDIFSIAWVSDGKLATVSIRRQYRQSYAGVSIFHGF